MDVSDEEIGLTRYQSEMECKVREPGHRWVLDDPKVVHNGPDVDAILIDTEHRLRYGKGTESFLEWTMVYGL